MTSTGDWVIRVVSGRLLDNPGGKNWHVCIQYNVLRHTTISFGEWVNICLC